MIRRLIKPARFPREAANRIGSMGIERESNAETGRDWLSCLGESQRAIVEALKLCGTASAKQLAEKLFLTIGGVRHHLTLMASSGLVKAHQERGPRGRPGLHYELTERGHGLFVDGHAVLATEIISELAEHEPAVLEVLMASRASRLLGEAKRLAPGDRAEDRMAGAVSVFERHGCMPLLEVESDGSERITLRHCPLLAAARVSTAICDTEVTFLHAALGGRQVTIEQSRPGGASVCVLRVDPFEGGAAAG